ncbi:hypothetical protein D9M72_562700 [compost metagenome]
MSVNTPTEGTLPLLEIWMLSIHSWSLPRCPALYEVVISNLENDLPVAETSMVTLPFRAGIDALCSRLPSLAYRRMEA